MNTDEVKEYLINIGRRGGLATKAKHGKKHYSRIGKLSRGKTATKTKTVQVEVESK